MKAPQDFFNIYRQSAWEQDAKTMIALYHDNVVVFDMWSEAYLIGITKWSKAIEDWLGSLGAEKVRVTFDMIDIRENESLAFGTALIAFEAISPQKAVLRKMRNRISLGFIKVNDEWKVIHQHTSAPINSELQAILSF